MVSHDLKNRWSNHKQIHTLDDQDLSINAYLSTNIDQHVPDFVHHSRAQPFLNGSVCSRGTLLWKMGARDFQCDLRDIYWNMAKPVDGGVSCDEACEFDGLFGQSLQVATPKTKFQNRK